MGRKGTFGGWLCPVPPWVRGTGRQDGEKRAKNIACVRERNLGCGADANPRSAEKLAVCPWTCPFSSLTFNVITCEKR